MAHKLIETRVIYTTPALIGPSYLLLCSKLLSAHVSKHFGYSKSANRGQKAELNCDWLPRVAETIGPW